MSGAWIAMEGELSDGKPMRVFLAERAGEMWAVSLHDDAHRRTDSEFVWALEKGVHWEKRATALLKRAEKQIREYFTGKRKQFDLPLAWRGTEFQNRVWQQLLKIPYGTVQTYGEVAQAMGKPGAGRAVGGANRENCLGLVVPCHRVTAAGGKLGGYNGGETIKVRLLRHEAVNPDFFRQDNCRDRKLSGLFL